MQGERRRLIVIGLDSASPGYLFGRCRRVMPNVDRLLRHAVRAPLRTTDPPISVPAWPVMFTGVDPGTLGLYGFRHRVDHSYTKTRGPVSTDLPVPTLWSLLSQNHRRVCVIGMPLGYPPPPVNGVYISDFLTPAGAHDFTFPEPLAGEIERKYGSYVFDVTFRAEERDQLYQDIVRMTQVRFAIAEDLYLREPWDVFAIHEIGTDRLHHAYTKYFDPDHLGYVPGNRFEHCLNEYYRVVDQGIGRILAHRDERTSVCIVSDHGSMPMAGCFCVNQWLAEKGYLSLGPVPVRGTALDAAVVDWSRTRAWGAGGYYARIFFNLKGREKEGIVAPADLPALRKQLELDLATIRKPDGTPFKTRVLDPVEIYHNVQGEPPDMMVYFDDLRWRSAGTLGHPTNFLRENDIGPDDAVHAVEGVFVLADSSVAGELVLPTQEILDVTPTLLALLGEALPKHLQGRPMGDALLAIVPRRAPEPGREAPSRVAGPDTGAATVR
jgi:predicted AlkP superfamily phosphohydrolase/phosphomutase